MTNRMKTPLAIVTLTLALASATLPAMAGCDWHEKQAANCAAGYQWDAAQEACVPKASS